MIALATNARLKAFMQRNAAASALARSFVGGVDIAEAVAAARRLGARGIRASLFHLGEYVTDPGAVAETVRQKVAIAEALGRAELDVHVSVDPTQIGHSIDPALCERNALQIGAAIARQPPNHGLNRMMLDMEDYSLVEPTLALLRRLSGERIPAAITLQAYLFRTERDVMELIRLGSSVRLVKGAFSEATKRAFRRRTDIDRNYLHLASLMLSAEARGAGFYPVFGTHDDALIQAIQTLAAERGWAKGQYEFEMLFGVRPELQSALREQGETVRVYLPFGRDWWPYAMRRVGEAPRNVVFLLRALLHGPKAPSRTGP
jgi:proline dehydrogenase